MWRHDVKGTEPQIPEASSYVLEIKSVSGCALPTSAILRFCRRPVRCPPTQFATLVKLYQLGVMSQTTGLSGGNGCRHHQRRRHLLRKKGLVQTSLTSDLRRLDVSLTAEGEALCRPPCPPL